MEQESALMCSPHRCPTCKSTSENPRNLVVFIDGTGNKPGDKNTNVWKLSRKVANEHIGDSGVEQLICYFKGIGTDDITVFWRAGKAIFNGLEMAFAWNVEANIKDAYMWLADHYQAGDQIYLFGFSRGAYQVRALASIIHEVGLAKKEEVNRVGEAYDKYLAIDPYNPDTREQATQFKQSFCQHGVRIHFIGVWDTVSSLGIVKKDVHITASASVTNACHFRHALALDERRVKFMPEYFSEMNALRSVHSPRLPVCDVKEVWFAGCHSDVGGTDRPSRDENPGANNSCNMSLSWMTREATTNGLVLKPRESVWHPQDIGFCIKNSMSFPWMIVEIIPIRHQVGFSGTGKHKRRRHLFRPRLIIPGQQIHDSALSSASYAPHATLAGGVCIRTATAEAFSRHLATENLVNGTTTQLLSLLTDREAALKHFEVVFSLLSTVHQGQGAERIQSLLGPQWLQTDGQSDFDKFALTVIYDMAFDLAAPEALVSSARASLGRSLRDVTPKANLRRTLYVSRFLIKEQRLRRRFIDGDVIDALVLLLDQIANDPDEILFLLVMDCLYHLIRDDMLRDEVVKAVHPKIRTALKSKLSNHLIALLKMITSIAQFSPDQLEALKPKIFKLAKNRSGLVCSAAIEVLVALRTPLTQDIRFPNILSYIADCLPQLDAEIDSVNELPSTPLGIRSESLNEENNDKLVLAVKSNDVHERIVATFAVLKLCNNPGIRRSFSQVPDVFLQQLEKKETSLLAAYALITCLTYNMLASDDFDRAALLIIAMVDNCWFDDAVGRVEGCEIFRRLMAYAGLRSKVIDLGIVDTLVRKLELKGGGSHEVRMSLLCLDILGEKDPLDLKQIVGDYVNRLQDGDKETQTKCARVLAALSRTTAGEEVIKPHLIKIIEMPFSSPPLSEESFGPAAALYDLSKNETLRIMILESQEFKALKKYVQHTTTSGNHAVTSLLGDSFEVVQEP